MTNRTIAQQFQLIAQLMELHGEHSYKIRSYNKAYRNLGKVHQELKDLTIVQLKAIKGVGNTIASQIRELLESGNMAILERLKGKTPKGILEMLSIRGLGIKKIKMLWDTLGIESAGELQYACKENRLVELKGFGKKTQEDLKKQLQFLFTHRDKFRYASLATIARNLVVDLQNALDLEDIYWTGAMRRLMPVVDRIDILIAQKEIQGLWDKEILEWEHQQHEVYHCYATGTKVPVRLFTCDPKLLGYTMLKTTGSRAFVQAFSQNYLPQSILSNAPQSLFGLSEKDLFERASLPYIPPERRDQPNILDRVKKDGLGESIEQQNFKGVLHLHSNWSDGSSSIEAMAQKAMALGYAYMGVTDHSKSAFYANGLKEDRVKAQHLEIDRLNKKFAPFRIFKGIESDILYDGSLDYDNTTLASFDFILASIHTHLKMTRERATNRLLKAIAHPYTSILGHPTGRLLLSREGYPIDHKKIINACAKYRVCIELNANPYRLDIDYQWIDYCMQQGVSIAITPDAHHPDQLSYVRYGVNTAQKAGLSPKYCLNLLNTEDFVAWIKNKKLKLDSK